MADCKEIAKKIVNATIIDYKSMTRRITDLYKEIDNLKIKVEEAAQSGKSTTKIEKSIKRREAQIMKVSLIGFFDGTLDSAVKSDIIGNLKRGGWLPESIEKMFDDIVSVGEGTELVKGMKGYDATDFANKIELFIKNQVEGEAYLGKYGEEVPGSDAVFKYYNESTDKTTLRRYIIGREFFNLENDYDDLLEKVKSLGSDTKGDVDGLEYVDDLTTGKTMIYVDAEGATQRGSMSLTFDEDMVPVVQVVGSPMKDGKRIKGTDTYAKGVAWMASKGYETFKITPSTKSGDKGLASMIRRGIIEKVGDREYKILSTKNVRRISLVDAIKKAESVEELQDIMLLNIVDVERASIGGKNEIVGAFKDKVKTLQGDTSVVTDAMKELKDGRDYARVYYDRQMADRARDIDYRLGNVRSLEIKDKMAKLIKTGNPVNIKVGDKTIKFYNVKDAIYIYGKNNVVADGLLGDVVAKEDIIDDVLDSSASIDDINDEAYVQAVERMLTYKSDDYPERVVGFLIGGRSADKSKTIFFDTQTLALEGAEGETRRTMELEREAFKQNGPLPLGDVPYATDELGALDPMAKEIGKDEIITIVVPNAWGKKMQALRNKVVKLQSEGYKVQVVNSRGFANTSLYTEGGKLYVGFKNARVRRGTIYQMKELGLNIDGDVLEDIGDDLFLMRKSYERYDNEGYIDNLADRVMDQYGVEDINRVSKSIQIATNGEDVVYVDDYAQTYSDFTKRFADVEDQKEELIKISGQEIPEDMNTDGLLDALYDYHYARTADDKIDALSNLSVYSQFDDRTYNIVNLFKDIEREYNIPYDGLYTVVQGLKNGKGIPDAFVARFAKTNDILIEGTTTIDTDAARAYINRKIEDHIFNTKVSGRSTIAPREGEGFSIVEVGREEMVENMADVIMSLKSVNEGGKGLVLNSAKKDSATKLYDGVIDKRAAEVQKGLDEGYSYIKMDEIRRKYIGIMDKLEQRDIPALFSTSYSPTTSKFDIIGVYDKGSMGKVDDVAKQMKMSFREKIDDYVDTLGLKTDEDMYRAGFKFKEDPKGARVKVGIDDEIVHLGRVAEDDVLKGVTADELSKMPLSDKVGIHKRLKSKVVTSINNAEITKKIYNDNFSTIEGTDFFNNYIPVDMGDGSGRLIPQYLKDDNIVTGNVDKIDEYMDMGIKKEIYDRIVDKIKKFGPRQSQNMAMVQKEIVDVVGTVDGLTAKEKNTVIALYSIQFSPYSELGIKLPKKATDAIVDGYAQYGMKEFDYGFINQYLVKDGDDAFVAITNTPATYADDDYVDDFVDNVMRDIRQSAEDGIAEASGLAGYRRSYIRGVVASALEDGSRSSATINRTIQNLSSDVGPQAASTLMTEIPSILGRGTMGQKAGMFFGRASVKFANAVKSAYAGWSGKSANIYNWAIGEKAVENIRRAQELLPELMDLTETEFVRLSREGIDSGDKGMSIAYHMANYFRTMRNSMGVDGTGKGSFLDAGANNDIYNAWKSFLDIDTRPSADRGRITSQVKGYAGAIESGNILRFTASKSVESETLGSWIGKVTKSFIDDNGDLKMVSTEKGKMFEDVDGFSDRLNEIMGTDYDKFTMRSIMQSLYGFKEFRWAEAIIDVAGAFLNLAPLAGTVRGLTTIVGPLISGFAAIPGYVNIMNAMMTEVNADDAIKMGQFRRALDIQSEFYSLDDMLYSVIDNTVSGKGIESNSLIKRGLQSEGLWDDLGKNYLKAYDDIMTGKLGRTMRLLQNGNNLYDIVMSGTIKNAAYVQAMKNNAYMTFDTADEFLDRWSKADRDQRRTMQSALNGEATRRYTHIMGINFSSIYRGTNPYTGAAGLASSLWDSVTARMSYLSGWGDNVRNSTVNLFNDLAYMIPEMVRSKRTPSEVVEIFMNIPEFKNYMNTMAIGVTMAVRAAKLVMPAEDKVDGITVEDIPAIYEAFKQVLFPLQGTLVSGQMRPFGNVVEDGLFSIVSGKEFEPGTVLLNGFKRVLFNDVKTMARLEKSIKMMQQEDILNGGDGSILSFSQLYGILNTLIVDASQGALRYTAGEAMGGDITLQYLGSVNPTLTLFGISDNPDADAAYKLQNVGKERDEQLMDELKDEMNINSLEDKEESFWGEVVGGAREIGGIRAVLDIWSTIGDLIIGKKPKANAVTLSRMIDPLDTTQEYKEKGYNLVEHIDEAKMTLKKYGPSMTPGSPDGIYDGIENFMLHGTYNVSSDGEKQYAVGHAGAMYNKFLSNVDKDVLDGMYEKAGTMKKKDRVAYLRNSIIEELQRQTNDDAITNKSHLPAVWAMVAAGDIRTKIDEDASAKGYFDSNKKTSPPKGIKSARIVKMVNEALPQLAEYNEDAAASIFGKLLVSRHKDDELKGVVKKGESGNYYVPSLRAAIKNKYDIAKAVKEADSEAMLANTNPLLKVMNVYGNTGAEQYATIIASTLEYIRRQSYSQDLKTEMQVELLKENLDSLLVADKVMEKMPGSKDIYDMMTGEIWMAEEQIKEYIRERDVSDDDGDGKGGKGKAMKISKIKIKDLKNKLQSVTGKNKRSLSTKGFKTPSDLMLGLSKDTQPSPAKVGRFNAITKSITGLKQYKQRKDIKRSLKPKKKKLKI